MILEKAVLCIKPGQAQDFEVSFAQASQIISSMPGYVSHELLRCLADEARYLLLVQWESVAHHEQGFRGSPEYQQWKALLHHYYDPFPVVEYFDSVFKN